MLKLNSKIWGVVACLSSLTCFAVQAETLVEDFEKSPKVITHRPKERGAEFTLGTALEPRGTSGKITWKDKHHKFNEFWFHKPIPLPEFDDKLDGTISFWVCPGEGNRAERMMAVRLIDAKGEVFQYKCAPINHPLKPGWQKVTCRITPDNTQGSWGDRSDKKFDLPARFFGFSIDYNSKVKGQGSLFIDDISHKGTTKAKVKIQRTFWRFDKTEDWRVRGGGWGELLELKNGKFELALKKGGHVVNMFRRGDRIRAGVGHVKTSSLNKDQLLLHGKGKIDTFMLSCDLIKGSKVQVAPVMKTERNKSLVFKFKALNSGQNSLSWKIPDDLTNPDVLDVGPYWVADLVIRSEKSLEPVAIKFNSASITERVPPAQAITMSVETGNPIHVLKPDSKHHLSFHLRNDALDTINCRVKVSLENFFFQTIRFSKSFVICPQAKVTWECPALPHKLGIWWVNYQIYSKGDEFNGRHSFAYMKPAGPTPGRVKGFIFGMCTHSERWSAGDQELEALATGLCGAKVIRTGPEWHSIERADNQWDFKLQDRLVDLYAKNGVDTQFLLAFTPKWAAQEAYKNAKTRKEWNRRAPKLDAWRDYVRTMATRYGKNNRFYEVWNEPDLKGFFRDGSKEYIEMLKAAYEEIKSVDPNLQVLTGGFASIMPRHGMSEANFHEKVVKQAEGYYDVHAFHQHGYFDSFQKSVDGKFSDVRKTLKDPKPVYFNETAYHSRDDTQRYQAETLVKKMLFSMARGAMGYNWYDLRNDGFELTNVEHNFGLLTNDFYPKAAYPAYNNLVLNFRGKKFVKQLALKDGRWAFVFAGNDEQTIVAWNQAGFEADEHLVLTTDAAAAELVDIMGNAHVATIDNQMVVLPVSATPVYLTLKGAKQVPAVKRNLIKVKESATLVPGRVSQFVIEVYNPFSTPQEFSLNLYVPEGVKANWLNRNVGVAPGGTADAVLELVLAAEKAVNFDDSLPLKVLYRIAGSTWSGTVMVPLNMAKLVKADLVGKPDFILNKHAQVVNKCENDPTKLHLTWQGPKDLSAKVYLGKKENSILLDVDVTDDIHCQKYSKDAVWQGDNIQVAMQIPGQVGFWEIGLTHLADGKPQVHCWLMPKGMADPAAKIKLITRKTAIGVKYQAKIPFEALGITAETLAKGIKFNMIVNDNDGELREGWIQIAPGIAGRKDADPYPFLVFD